MWPLIVGGALLAGGTAASMYGNNKAMRAGAAVLQAENRRQRGFDRELGTRTDQLLAESVPVAAMGDELREGGNAAAELNTQAQAIQSGATAAGGQVLTAGRSNRVSSAARNLARARAAKKKADQKDLTRGQFTLDRSRIQQRSQNSQAIAGVEAQDAAQAGSGWRTAGGLMQSAGFLSMLA
jgi:hypothetical protein